MREGVGVYVLVGVGDNVPVRVLVGVSVGVLVGELVMIGGVWVIG